MLTVHWIWLLIGIGLFDIALLAGTIYLYYQIKSTLSVVMEYHSDFAGSHERLERWVRGINKDMNLLAAAIGADRDHLRKHDQKVDGLVADATRIAELLKEQNRILGRNVPEEKRGYSSANGI